MKDKETQNNVFDILDKMEFFQGQRAGRELWNDKPKEVQDKDIADFIKDINYIRSYLQDSVVLSREEQERILTATEKRIEGLKKQISQTRKETAKEFAEKLKNKLFEFFQDNEELDGKISVGPLYVDVIGVEAKDGTIISLGLIDRLLKDYEK